MEPFVSIITVNYNGKHLLQKFINSVISLNYPDNKFELIVVDNGSSDGSIEYLQASFPKVRLIKSKKNRGFGGGNNIGIRKAKGTLLLLVNNDTFLEKNCLKEAVATFNRLSKKTRVGALSLKLVLYDKFIPLNVEEAYLHDFVLENDNSKGVYSSPYIIPNNHDLHYNQNVYLPINFSFKGNLTIKFTFKKLCEPKYSMTIFGGKRYEDVFSNSDNFRELRIVFNNNELQKTLVNLLQNAGNYIFRDGYGRDRGSIIIGGRQYYEVDREQYSKEEEIPAFCGAGVILNKAAIKDVGYFDERFFMYYEDDDYSLRLRKAGWKIYFSPQAVIRHIHAASSKEWSSAFIYNVERSRLLFVLKHWPRRSVIIEWFKYIAKDTLGVPIWHLLYGETRQAVGKFGLRVMVNISLLKLAPLGFLENNRINLSELKSLL